jgi:Leucine-rich repeat (LRR) protein
MLAQNSATHICIKGPHQHSLTEAAVIRYCNITSLPDDFVNTVRKATPNIIELDLTSNGLTELPDDLHLLTHLRVLRVKYNKLTAVPAACLKLAECMTLDLAGNLISSIPDGIAQLQALRELDLSGNQVTQCTRASQQSQSHPLLTEACSSSPALWNTLPTGTHHDSIPAAAVPLLHRP